MERATRVASKWWQASFNAGDAAVCAACYEETAVMITAPFGTLSGREQFLASWEKLIGDGFADVTYVDPQIEIIDETSACLSAGWTMNEVLSREQWVLQSDGRVLLREDQFEASA